MKLKNPSKNDKQEEIVSEWRVEYIDENVPYTDLVKEWAEQGRNSEMIYGVVNFMTSSQFQQILKNQRQELKRMVEGLEHCDSNGTFRCSPPDENSLISREEVLNLLK